MSISRSDDGSKYSVFIKTVVHDAITYYRKNNLQPELDNILRKAMSLSSSGRDSGLLSSEIRLDIINAALAHFKEKQQEAEILQKVFLVVSKGSLSGSSSTDEFFSIQQEIFNAAKKHYAQERKTDAVFGWVVFAILAHKFSEMMPPIEKYVTAGPSVSRIELGQSLTVHPAESSKVDQKELAYVVQQIQGAISDVFSHRDQYPFFEEALQILRPTRRFSVALNEAIEALQNAIKGNGASLELGSQVTILLDEVIKAFEFDDNSSAKFQELYENLCDAYPGLTHKMINEIVIPGVIARQAELFLKDHIGILTKTHTEVVSTIRLVLNNSLLGSRTAVNEDRLALLNLGDEELNPLFSKPKPKIVIDDSKVSPAAKDVLPDAVITPRAQNAKLSVSGKTQRPVVPSSRNPSGTMAQITRGLEGGPTSPGAAPTLPSMPKPVSVATSAADKKRVLKRDHFAAQTSIPSTPPVTPASSPPRGATPAASPKAAGSSSSGQATPAVSPKSPTSPTPASSPTAAATDLFGHFKRGADKVMGVTANAANAVVDKAKDKAKKIFR